ncbi:MAG: hypothetical protein HKM93_09810 [Desulfobacteraceae bacterium]|nr:hypothetical protein [Desulfobacteraceae bacterium]
MATQWIYSLQELRSDHNDMVGKKCANLGEMTHMGMRVPPGFAVSVEGYELFMNQTGADAQIRQYVRKNLASLHHNVEKQVEAGRYIRRVIESKEMPEPMKADLWRHYERLCEQVDMDRMPVAVRSSGAVSMPGQMETYLNVRGRQELIEKIIKVWSSAFTTRAIAFRLEQGMAMEKAPIGVAVLKMVNARSAGVTLTVLPTNGDLSKVIVEGNWGLGESVVSGEITPDSFIVNKDNGHVASTISKKNKMVVFETGGIAFVDVPPDRQEQPCLSDIELKEIVRIAMEVENYFDAPQDMEWVLDQDLTFPENLFWVQTRPAKYSKPVADNTEYLAELMTRIFKM